MLEVWMYRKLGFKKNNEKYLWNWMKSKYRLRNLIHKDYAFISYLEYFYLLYSYDTLFTMLYIRVFILKKMLSQ